MTRFMVFLALGPMVGLFTIVGLLELLVGGPKSENGLANMPVLVLVAYFFGLIPAAVACVADWIARHLKSLSRMGVTVGAGYAATSLSMLLITSLNKNNFTTVLAYGLVGVVPGYCLLLANGEAKQHS